MRPFSKLLTAAIGAAAISVGTSCAPAQAQSGCGLAMADFQAALKANTAEALGAYLDQHAPCFEAPARARLEALGGAPEAATASPRYEGAQITLNILGSPDYLGPLVGETEARFWTEAVPSIGNVSVELQPNYGGVNAFEYAEHVANGGADGALLHSSDAIPLQGAFGSVLAGLDVPLVASDASSARAMHRAVRDQAAAAMAKQGLTLLGAAPLLPELMVCNDPVSRLEDLSGKTVRAYGKDHIVEAWGGEALTAPASEILSVMERDILDCTSFMPSFHYRIGTHRLGGSLIRSTLIDWGVSALVMNADIFDGLPEEVRRGLLDAARTAFEEPVWAGVEARIEADIQCMTGRGSCPEGVEPGNLALAGELTADATAKRLLTDVVLPNWAETAPAALVEGWREAVAGIIGIPAR